MKRTEEEEEEEQGEEEEVLQDSCAGLQHCWRYGAAPQT